MKFLMITLKAIALVNLFDLHYSNANCIPEGFSCSEDCDCCGYGQDPPYLCQLRHHSLGRRCYQSGGLGAVCEENDDCLSQTCINGICAPKSDRPPYQEKCPFGEESVTNVIGTRKENDCSCPNAPLHPTTSDALRLFDENLNTVYSNSYAINGGIEFTPIEKASLRFIEICTSADAPESDPTCYNLEGFCDETQTYKSIQEGPLDLPLTRKECIQLPIIGLPLYSKYRLTFPCQRGVCREDCGGFCRAGPVYSPNAIKCQGYVDDGTNEVGTLDLIKFSYDATTDITTFLYSILNFDLLYMTLSWFGDCSMNHYYVFEDINGNKIIDTNEVCCFRKCGVDFLWPEENGLEVCMPGLELWSSSFANSGLFIIQLLITGEVNNVQYKQYGAYGKSGQIEYGEVLSPVCPETLCEATCPLKLSEINFLTNCNEFLAA